MSEKNFLAFDLGATSGRGVVGSFSGGKFTMREVYRFPNGIMELHGKYYWNVYQLYAHLKECLTLCAKEGIRIDSIGVDTWGVDFGYIAKDGTLLGLPRAYRDPYTAGASEEFFGLVPREELYRLTGIQIMDINSLFQLFRARAENFAPLEAAEEILFMPDLLSYLLTGERVCEYTEASTSQLLNPVSRSFETSLLQAAGLKPSLLRPLVMPGTQIGTLTEALARETGVGQVPVVAVAGHDTASAVAAVPALDPHFAYLSSGTWSLLGIETTSPIITEESFHHNFTNEGGVEGTTRFLKNITGMWLLEQCRKEWEKEGFAYSYPQIVAMAEEAATFTSLVNPDDPRFANPRNMPEAIRQSCAEQGVALPETHAQYVHCIFISLANRYRETVELLQKMAPFPIERLHVIGGGAKNALLNQLTADAIGLPVVAGPSEATAIGNCLMQAKAAGLVSDRWEIRKIVADSFPPETFLPKHS